MGVTKLKNVTEITGGLKEEISDFKRRRIREEACHLFFKNGYESTTIDAIAQKLDVTKPFIYSYYRNKSELLYDISRTGIALSLEAIEQTSQIDRPATERLRLLVERVLRIIFDYQEYIVVYEREEKNLDKTEARRIREQRKLFDHLLAELLEQGQQSGEFTVNDSVMTATTIAGIITWVSFWYSPSGRKTELEIFNHILAMVEALVRPTNKYDPAPESEKGA